MRTSILTNNQFDLMGRVSQDVNEYGNGVASISLAMNNGKDSEGNAGKTYYLQIKSFQKSVYSLIRKGMMLRCIGHIQPNIYEKNGSKIYSTDLVADYIGFLETKEQVAMRMAKAEMAADFD